jgi:hypothetical protein
VYALTPIVCAAQPGRVSIRVEPAAGDRSVVPAGRRYLLRVRAARPRAVMVEGSGELQHVGGDTGRPGWWMDEAGFLCVRPSAVAELAITVTSGT